MAVKSTKLYTSNEYLEPMTEWNESKVYRYKSQTIWFICSGIITYALLGVIFAFLSCIGFLLFHLIFIDLIGLGGLLNAIKFTWLLKALPYIFCAGMGIWFFVKFKDAGDMRLFLFVKRNHGEVAHPKHFFRMLIYIFTGISAAAFLASTVLCIIAAVNVGDESPVIKLAADNLNLWGTYVKLQKCLVVLPVFAFFMGVVNRFRNGMNSCPMCGRYESVSSVKSGESYGSQSFGTSQYTETEMRRVHVSTTITYRGDKIVGRHENYDTVPFTRVGIEERGDELQDYFNYCEECGCYWEGTQVQPWSKRLS